MEVKPDKSARMSPDHPVQLHREQRSVSLFKDRAKPTMAVLRRYQSEKILRPGSPDKSLLAPRSFYANVVNNEARRGLSEAIVVLPIKFEVSEPVRAATRVPLVVIVLVACCYHMVIVLAVDVLRPDRACGEQGSLEASVLDAIRELCCATVR